MVFSPTLPVSLNYSRPADQTQEFTQSWPGVFGGGGGNNTQYDLAVPEVPLSTTFAFALPQTQSDASLLSRPELVACTECKDIGNARTCK